jgi:hypothetical protein
MCKKIGKHCPVDTADWLAEFSPAWVKKDVAVGEII